VAWLRLMSVYCISHDFWKHRSYVKSTQTSAVSGIKQQYLYRLRRQQGCSPKKEVGGRLKQDLDKDF